MEVFVESMGNIYDISLLCTDITFDEGLNAGASSITLTYIRDGLIVNNGDVIRITDKGQMEGIFYGTIFKVSTSNKGVVTIKAYDQLRYSKSKDIIVLEDGTLSQLVKNMCTFLSLKVGTIEESEIKLDTIAVSDKSYLDIINESIYNTLIISKSEKYYCLRDEFGKVCLRDIRNLQLPLVLGDNSLVHAYTYDKSIDEEYYNRVKVLWKDEKIGKQDLAVATDINALNKYGVLQYFESGKNISSSSQAKELAENLLKLYNKEKETLKLSCIGDLRVRAGNSFYASIADISVNKRLIVKKVSHSFLPVHTMEVEVMLSE